MTKRYRVLIVDDSATARAALRAALAGESRLEVVGDAADGPTALPRLSELAPDIITMDVFLRAENGLELAAQIMQTRATPIVVVTAGSPRDPSLVFRAMQAGVLEVCSKLPSPTHPEYEARRRKLVRTLKTLASVPVVHRRQVARRADAGQPEPSVSRARPAYQPSAPDASGTPSEATASRAARAATSAGPSGGMLLIGASTGGPPVLAKLLRALHKPFPLPIALVQHMAPGFTQSFAEWLARDTGHRVTVLRASQVATPGLVLVPMDDHHLIVEPGSRLAASARAPRGFYRPSVDLLFESALKSLLPAHTIGVLLTGMGSDGAQGLRALHEAGAYTLVQAPRTCTVASMPQRAIELGAAEQALAPEELAAVINQRATALGGADGG